jgi:PTS system nitrogen regulatory IIA component
MGEIGELVLPEAILPALEADSRQAALRTLCASAAQALGLHPRLVYDAVMERESLGGTGVGEGVAIPHARLPALDHPVGAFARLTVPVDFDAVDQRPADLVFMLLAPAHAGADHLKALSKVSRAFRRPEFRERLRAAHTREAVLALFRRSAESEAA